MAVSAGDDVTRLQGEDPAEQALAGSSADAGLMERVGRKDEAAVEQLVGSYGKLIRRVVFRVSGWREVRADLVQDVWVRVIENASQFRGEGEGPTLRAWLVRIAVNVCRAEGRKRALRRTFWRLWGGGFVRENDEPSDQSEVSRVVEEVRRLPVKYREVMVLHYLEEMETSEVAKALSLSSNTVEVRLSRARDMLRRRLGHER